MTAPVIPGDLLHRGKVIAGLRELADFLDQHPGAPVPAYGWDLNIYTGNRDGEAAARAQVGQVAALLGAEVCDQTGEGGHCTAERCFGLVCYRAVFIPERRMAAHRALMSYSGTVIPEAAP
jgi:hypothetical protein